MNSIFQKIINFFIIWSLLAFQVGCGTTGRRNAADSRSSSDSCNTFQPDYYSIKMKNGKKHKIEGSRLEKHGDLLAVISKDGAFESTYHMREIKEVAAVGGRKGSHALAGMGYGALGGLVIGGAIAGGFATQSCGGSGDPGDCRAFNKAGMIIAPTGLAIVGGLLGLGVGAVLPKKKKIIIIPSVSIEENQKHVGVGLTTSF